ncbi:bifunctional folylpolyglutamate synthase/dihydrofolate synthase [Ruminococcus sp.]|uniref:bifunctional folylpolyglutamate synthase/dihydrofolate synthase n=1 Tax=Ruminococcus sp. TaxID=41978 RepID=UPI00388FE82D
MNYEESLAFIHSLDKFGSRPGLDRVKQLADAVPGVLEQRFIHVAGTNGKGSVCTMLSAVLAAAGYRVGLFTSPYVVDFRERIQIDNRMIGRDDLAAAVTFFAPILKELSDKGVIITEFEFLTVLAFWVFRQQGCDIIVCEAGMGGLLDSTNLIPHPLCAVITRIDLDHTAVLGDTIEAIAYQKAGIIKESSAVAVAPQLPEAFRVILSAAAEKHNSVYRAEEIGIKLIETNADGTRFSYRGEEMFLPLVGAYQIDNLRCALAALEALKESGVGLSSEEIRAGLSRVRHPARFEKLGNDPVVILDGAHNPNGLTAFAEAVRATYPEGDKTLIIGMLADKDSTSVHLLRGLFRRVIVTDIDNPRALPAERLAERLVGIAPEITVIHQPAKAYQTALSFGDDTFICGSLYLASELRPEILT